MWRSLTKYSPFRGGAAQVFACVHIRLWSGSAAPHMNAIGSRVQHSHLHLEQAIHQLCLRASETLSQKQKYSAEQSASMGRSCVDYRDFRRTFCGLVSGGASAGPHSRTS